MQKATSYNLDVCSLVLHWHKEGQRWGFRTGRRLAPVSEVEAGNFRPAGQLRDQVVVQSPVRRPGPGSRMSGGSAVTPSLHPEALETQFVSPGRGLGIRQSMG